MTLEEKVDLILNQQKNIISLLARRETPVKESKRNERKQRYEENILEKTTKKQ